MMFPCRSGRLIIIAMVYLGCTFRASLMARLFWAGLSIGPAESYCTISFRGKKAWYSLNNSARQLRDQATSGWSLDVFLIIYLIS
jgi:hypothetical protein